MVLLFMVHGLFNSVKFPYAHFATKNITADTLFPIVWEAVEHLEISELNVIAVCMYMSPYVGVGMCV